MKKMELKKNWVPKRPEYDRSIYIAENTTVGFE